MLPLSYTAGDPLFLTLAADARLCQTDYTDDQIWELRLGGGEPPALALETTYGLRANRMRMFPRFLRAGVETTNPASFHQPPRLVESHPGYLAVAFSPYEELDMLAEYWAAQSNLVIGRIRITNHSVLTQTFRLEWTVLLSPRDQQGGMAPFQSGNLHFLAGETGNLVPVVFLSGGALPTAGPYPSMELELELYPGNTRLLNWAAAGLREQSQGLDAVRSAIEKNWDAEITRLEMLDSSQTIQFQTGIADWDAALALAQRSAFQFFECNPGNLPNPSLVLTRRPDQGFSALGDGRDHPQTWRGQTALDAWYLAQLLPGAPHLAAGLLRNFLSVQDAQGRIEAQPGLGGLHSLRRAQPILATLAEQLAPHFDAHDWYREIYPGLLRFFKNWVEAGDGIPQWENPYQSAIEDSPIYNRFGDDGRGIETAHLISPAILAMLYQECQSLIHMAQTLETNLGTQEDLKMLHTVEARLQALLSETWDPASGLYRYRDYQTRLGFPSASVVSFQGSGSFPTRRRFKQPRRIVIRIESPGERSSAASFTIYGYTPEGEVSEEVPSGKIAWLGNQAHVATEHSFLAIERVDSQGLREQDRVRVFTPDFMIEDCSLLLPLWAGIPNTERARQLVETSLLTRFSLPYGIPIAPGQVDTISMPWNTFIGEGLLRYGYRAQAADLFTHLMNAILPLLKNQQTFYQYYQATSGQPEGERGHLHGLPPVSLFLKILGIQLITPNEIIINGFNPFPGTITVQYRKVHLTCHADRTEITFPAGQHIVIDHPGPHRITLI